MARIPDGEIDRLKREVAVQRLAEQQGIKLNRVGNETFRRIVEARP